MRDTTENDEPRPTRDVGAEAAETVARSPSGAAFVAEDERAPRRVPSDREHPPALNDSSPHELAAWIPAPEPQAQLPAEELSIQFLLPHLELDAAMAAGPLGGKPARTLRRLRDSIRRDALKAAQIELWPDDEAFASHISRI